MPDFRCSTTGGGYLKTISATNHEDAAENWAEEAHSDSAGEWSEGAMSVQQLRADGSDDGPAQTFEIKIDWIPSFTAYRT